MKNMQHRIAGLDGIRAFAVATVVLCHLQQRFSIFPTGLTAPDGVELFFVLSGFLITMLLLREQDRTGNIAVRSFYGRRASRILPPLLVYLGIAVAVCLFTRQVVPWPSILSAGLFAGGIYPRDPSFLTEHVWTLAVEEQFYVVWPLLLIWALRRGGRRLAVLTAVSLIAASPFIRVGMTYIHWSLLAHKQAILLPARMDSLFAGCLVALSSGSARFEQMYRKVSPFWWTALLFFCVVSPLLRIIVGNAYTFTIGYTLESLAMAYFVVWVSRTPESVIGRVLSQKPVALLGAASYSIYLYQSALIHKWPGFTQNYGPGGILAAVLVAGLASFYLVEKPAFWLRDRMRKPAILIVDQAVPARPFLPVKFSTLSK